MATKRKFPNIIGRQPTTPEEQDIAKSALAKSRKRRNSRRQKKDATTTAYQGGDDYKNY
jgi:hypothetical protein